MNKKKIDLCLLKIKDEPDFLFQTVLTRQMLPQTSSNTRQQKEEVGHLLVNLLEQYEVRGMCMFPTVFSLSSGSWERYSTCLSCRPQG